MANMFKLQTLFLLPILLSINPIAPYSTGAPDIACIKMTPGHGFDPQNNDDIPVTLSVSPESPIAAGGTVTITLAAKDGERGFQGFLIQARRVSSHQELVGDQENELVVPLGEFNTREASYLGCSGGVRNTITHRNNREKRSMSAQWIAPEDYKGEIYFKYTVVLDYFTYWVGVETAKIEVTRDSTVSNATETTTLIDVPKYRYRRDIRSK